jgi:phosphatidylinositol alpha-mannosyltransferase
MKIAMVSPYDLGEFGGVQNQVQLLAEQMLSRGHQVTIVGPGQLASPIRFVSLGPSRDFRANDSVAPISLHPAVAGKLRRAVARSDVVHVHEPLMPLVGLAARWTGKPLVGTFHADPSGFVRRLYRGFFPLKWHMAKFSSLTAVSETARSAVASFGDVSIVPNGVTTARIPPRNPIPGRVVFVGRDDERKGLDVAIEAISLIRRELPAVELVVVTPDEVEEREGVTVLRGIADDEKLQILASAETLVAPNRGGESFGLIVAEAMASGCVVVASDLPAFRDVLGDAGLYAPVGDAVRFAEVIAAVLNDSPRLKRISKAATVRSEQFSITHTADAYEVLYREAIGVNESDEDPDT